LKRNSQTGSDELSLYTDREAVLSDITVQMARLKVSFPKMEGSFFNILAERILSNKFTVHRLKDAVNQIIDNFQYRELTVSDIIRFDKRIKLYTYNEVCNLITKGQASFDEFEVREIDGCHYRIKKTDLL
jgi:hypothetical protein